MGIRIQTGASTYTELTGTKGIFVQTGASTYNRAEKVYVQTGTSTYVLAYQFDTTGPVVPTPTANETTTNVGTSDTVSWGAITDAGSGVASATVYQLYHGSTSGFVAGTNQVLSTFGASSTTFAIPTNRRNKPTGETWQVAYYIIATDVAGNSLQGTGSATRYTKPLGTYSYIPTTADARNIGNTAWLGQDASSEGVVGVSTTKFIGAWFYGSGAFTAHNFTQWDPDSGTIFLKRASSVQTNRGNSGTFSIKMHGSGTKSGALTLMGTTTTQSLSGNDASAYLALDASQLANIGDGDGQGFAMTAHSTGLGFLRGLTDYGGLVALVYN